MNKPEIALFLLRQLVRWKELDEEIMLWKSESRSPTLQDLKDERTDLEAAWQLARFVIEPTPAAPPPKYACSVCEDNLSACSKNYSGGWVGTPCPN